MDHGLIKASQRLSELDITIEIDRCLVRVYWFRVMFKDQDWFIRRHAHSTFEFHFIARGECEVLLDDGAFIAGKGIFFLTGPDVHHTQRPAGSPELIEYSLNCDICPMVPEELLPEKSEMAWLLSVLRNARCEPVQDEQGVLSLFEAALREAADRRPGFALNVRNLVLMILVAAARSIGGSAAASTAHMEGAPEDTRMARVEQFVADNIRQDLTPKDVAAYLNLSERQLGRIVMVNKGYSTKKFITRTKLKRAKVLLSDTDMPLKEIAEELGFSNEYYFNSVFKKHEGFPPGIFRASMRETGDRYH